ncbi:MAG: phage tail sheath subtilisin-like domain-containing protein [Pseudonocardiaceae bacterium]
MPISPTYPGVYIDELPSAVRTITGVPTSIAAFVGTAPRGAVDRPVHITSWADYEREFGGLDKTSEMSYAVYQFYLNGGSEAEIVRIVPAKPDPVPAPGAGVPAPTYPETATLELYVDGTNKVVLTAVSPGEWGNKLRARVDYHTADPTDTTLYNLTLRDTQSGVTESYLNVSTAAGSPEKLATVLASSGLVTKDVQGGDQRPHDHPLPSPPGPEKPEPLPVGQDPFETGPKREGDWYTTASHGSDGNQLPVHSDYLGGDNGQLDKTGLYQLLKTDIFNMLCLPGRPGQQTDNTDNIIVEAANLCDKRRAMLIVDPPSSWQTVSNAADAAALPVAGDLAKNAAVYFPQIRLSDPKQNNIVRSFPPCGVVAGIWARTDVQRGVWKAPAGTDASLNGVNELFIKMTDVENGRLNPRGINCIRQFPVYGPVLWGARTCKGADVMADQWKYVPVRRLALFVEESLFRGTQWVVFEPNDEPLWSSIRLNVGAFMNTLFRQGAFQGRTPQEAYLVKCDSTNNPQNDIDRGIVNILVGFAPLKPAEFVIIHIQQLAGQIQV